MEIRHKEHQDNMADFSATNRYTIDIQEHINNLFPGSNGGIPTAATSESSTLNGDERTSRIKSEPDQEQTQEGELTSDSKRHVVSSTADLISNYSSIGSAQDGFCFVDASSMVEVEIEPAVYSRRRSRRSKKKQENSEEDTSTSKEISENTVKEKSEPVYVCTECGKKFSHKCNMTSHMRTHTGETPFECPMCPKKFSHKCNLTSHMRTHTGETPFECSVCAKKFSHKCNLNTHMRIHTHEKPFECPICGKKFSHKCNLMAHMKTRCANQTMSATASILEEAARMINPSMLPPAVATPGPVTTSC